MTRVNGEDVVEKQQAENAEILSNITDEGNIKGFKVLTQAAYDALGTPDPEIVYLISG